MFEYKYTRLTHELHEVAPTILFSFNARTSTDSRCALPSMTRGCLPAFEAKRLRTQKTYTKRACKHVYATHAVYILNVCIVLTLTLASGSFYLNRTRDTVSMGHL